LNSLGTWLQVCEAVQKSRSRKLVLVEVSLRSHLRELRFWPKAFMSESAVPSRTRIVRQGRRLEYFTIAWNAFEGLVAVVAGAIAGSISLVGFGIDSFIEVTSGSVLLWRMSVDAEVHRRELNERRALRIVGVCFLLLAAYIGYESVLDLLVSSCS
jgi:hypothetical protein